jgi:FMN phosphatase YigB (HAD superfamily)
VERAVFLVDVDDTLLDNDRIRDDLREHIGRSHGEACRDRYAALEERLFQELGYRDYLGALQGLWLEGAEEMSFLEVSSFLLGYPFAERLYHGALEVLAHLGAHGPTVALTDGDAVFQPWKVDRSGIRAAVYGRVLVYVHKEDELADVERRYPAERYVLVDDKPRILAAVKRVWGDRVTTVLPRQGQYANGADAERLEPHPDLVIERVGSLLELDPRGLAAAPR